MPGERSRDPLTTNLVVADPSRTEKTICLAVSPSLKKYGLSGRARLFEVIQKVNAANNIRKLKAPNHVFSGSSDDSTELQKNPSLQDRLHNCSTAYGTLYGIQYKDL